MSNKTIFLTDCTWPELENLVNAKPVLIIPVGSIEQHGYHLPISTDINSVSALSRELGRDDVVVGSPIPFGYTRTMQSFPGTVTLSAVTFERLVRELLSEYLRLGFRDVLVLNGHYENFPLLIEAAELATSENASAGRQARIVCANWWDVLPRGLIQTLFGDASPPWAASHAGVVETSLALCMEPHRVRSELLQDDPPFEPLPYYVSPQRKSDIAPRGVAARLKASSATAGMRLRDATLAGLNKLIDVELR